MANSADMRQGACKGHPASCKAARRILARVENPDAQAPEADWIGSRIGILGEGPEMAARSVQSLIDDGSMLVVRVEAGDG